MRIPLSSGASVLLDQLVTAYRVAEQYDMPAKDRNFQKWRDGYHNCTFVAPVGLPQGATSHRFETTDEAINELRMFGLFMPTKPGGPIYMLTVRGLAQRD